jgi:hypothetical protein
VLTPSSNDDDLGVRVFQLAGGASPMEGVEMVVVGAKFPL